MMRALAATADEVPGAAAAACAQCSTRCPWPDANCVLAAASASVGVATRSPSLNRPSHPSTGCLSPRLTAGARAAPDQRRGGVDVARADRVPHRAVVVATGAVPVAGAAVQRCRALRLEPPQLGSTASPPRAGDGGTARPSGRAGPAALRARRAPPARRRSRRAAGPSRTARRSACRARRSRAGTVAAPATARAGSRRARTRRPAGPPLRSPPARRGRRARGPPSASAAGQPSVLSQQPRRRPRRRARAPASASIAAPSRGVHRQLTRAELQHAPLRRASARPAAAAACATRAPA